MEMTRHSDTMDCNSKGSIIPQFLSALGALGAFASRFIWSPLTRRIGHWLYCTTIDGWAAITTAKTTPLSRAPLQITLNKKSLHVVEEYMPALAQTCPHDILYEILVYIGDDDAARSALVCQQWLHPCRSRLYTRVALKTPSSSAEALCSSLCNSSLLRSYIRRVQILYSAHPTSSFDWITLLPPHELWSVEILQREHLARKDANFQALLLSSEAIRSIRRLHAETWSNSETWVEGWLSLPDLESVSLHFPGNAKLSLTNVPPLKRLSVKVDTYTPEIASLLIAVKATIVRFDLSIYRSSGTTGAELADAMISHANRLDHLAIEPGLRMPGKPFLDDVVPHLLELKYLYCGYTTCSSEIFARIPAGLETLQIQDVMHPMIPSLPLHAATTTAERVLRGELSLRRLTVIRHRDPTHVEMVRHACERAGIEFTYSSDRYNYDYDSRAGDHLLA